MIKLTIICDLGIKLGCILSIYSSNNYLHSSNDLKSSIKSLRLYKWQDKKQKRNKFKSITMIIRIVKMTFEKDKVDHFINFFEPFKMAIRNSPGCTYLQILRDVDQPHIIFSYSHWNNVADLDNYRYSTLFKQIWPTTKTYFAERPEAWTTNLLHDLP